ncbi:unnamed protein product [Kuraishia capsulata CBS 1993]|uniref:Protein kinase domain-containing protein n=1 Tax=Kuraishia capsulata CBS 1993 TaxID=1382522 RepID=W6MHZ2_9ASCO|nr:uncharacterized protein KUCA_T00001423001 [Kuraishia capsulata CBS 1993]CDK25453.1 unnamed protein product [Kuraishia capsulata CBS 1993]
MSAFPFGQSNGQGNNMGYQGFTQPQQNTQRIPQSALPLQQNYNLEGQMVDPLSQQPNTQFQQPGTYQQKYSGTNINQWQHPQQPQSGMSSMQTPRQAIPSKQKLRGFSEVELSPSLARHQSDNVFMASNSQSVQSGATSTGFKNPWYSPSSANVTNRLPGLQTSNQQEPPFLMMSPSRVPSFANALPTTYEYEGMQQQQHQQQQMLPVARAQAPRPPSDYFAEPNNKANELMRRQSVATPYSSIHGFDGNSFDYNPHQQPQLPHRGSFANQTPQRLPAPRMTKVRALSDLHPNVNLKPKYRRASATNTLVSPLEALTTALALTYSMCRSDFDYKSSKNPRRVLTKPSEGKSNNGHDNEESDYILYVNDVLGSQDGMKYMVLDVLGQGTFGQVVKCQNLKTQEIVAVKVIKSKPAFLNQSLTEVSILEHLNKKVDPEDQHHFLRLKDKFIHKNHLCLVFELLSSNLYELIKQNQFKGLALKLVKKFTVQLLDSLKVLKSAKIIHCDLKPENILLITPDKPLLKVIDFGAACHERQIVYAYIQSRFYRSPEVILGLSYTSSIDMWSLGCIIAELFLGTPLLPGATEYGQICRIVQMFGMPPTWMIEMGKNAQNYFAKEVVFDERTGKQQNVYRLKTIEQYSREFNVEEKPGKEYFEDKELPDIIGKYQLPKKNMTEAMVEKEMHQRAILIHFLQGIFNLNPLERWTPQEAAMHPFVTNQPFSGSWSPPSANYSDQFRLEKQDRLRSMEIDPVSFAEQHPQEGV